VLLLMMIMMMKLEIVVATEFMIALLVMKAMISEPPLRCFPFNLVAMNYKPVDEKQEMSG